MIPLPVIQHHYRHTYRARRKSDPHLREMDRLLRRVHYLRDKKRKLGYTGELTLAALWQGNGKTWFIRYFYLDYQTAQAQVKVGEGLRWAYVEKGREYVGFELGRGLR